ncbi:acidic endochitinase-like [Vigna unguiculata]|uniref:Acidic endochitinase n=1 Tax=Vigna unguiculata TaxID=3917 RepID=A0A4D6LBY9_VIGUN|nr:acidic endochitinase-like isoform X1 [Vigna unguiculata]XP_027910020.1 acidic endochitinase-like isoform X2 [Vigna unguiculata]XP_027911777.1 acidic endochitinase-like [Vigna unguiculata]QCD86067.1 chitinase [Vigna unguiculata]
MASERVALMIFLLSLFTLSSSRPDNAGIAVYWGRNLQEGDLVSACDTGNYKIVLLAFLNNFGAGRTSAWDFAAHCDNGAAEKCTELESEIKYCQEQRVKVFLSIGGDPDDSDYSLSSRDDAKEVAKYLYDNFLSGQYGPLGSVKLDGIDFHIEQTENYWDDLAWELDFFRQTTSRRFYLSAAPKCLTYPIPYLGKAIATKLFDYIFVQFYNNPSCSNTTGTEALLSSWNKWVGLVASNNSLFLGLPAGPTAGEGYISPDLLKRRVLPQAKKAHNYGGVMLWDRFRDFQTGYSDQILLNVNDHVSSNSVSDAIYRCVSKAFNRVIDY